MSVKVHGSRRRGGIISAVSDSDSINSRLKAVICSMLIDEEVNVDV